MGSRPSGALVDVIAGLNRQITALEEVTRVAELVAGVHAEEISREEALRASPYPAETMELALARGMRQLDGLPPD